MVPLYNLNIEMLNVFEKVYFQRRFWEDYDLHIGC